jgi:hypothetical protein
MFKFIGKKDKRYIQINKNKYIIKSLLELEIDEYFKFLEYVEKGEILKILRLITNIDDDILKIIDINSLYKDINWTEIMNELKVEEKKIDGMSVGDFNTLIYFVDSQEEHSLKNKKIYLYMKYLTSNKIQKLYYKYINDFNFFKKYSQIKDKKIKIGEVLPYIIGFNKFRKETIEGFTAIFKPVKKDEKQTNEQVLPTQNIGLMEILYSEIYTTGKSASDIQSLLNTNLYTFLNYYTWKIVQIKKEIKQQKQK